MEEVESKGLIGEIFCILPIRLCPAHHRRFSPQRVMWIIEGEFRDPEAANNLSESPVAFSSIGNLDKNVEVTLQQRWLRPARVYSLGRDALNDFSREKPKTLSRHRSITFDAGPYPTGELQDPNEPPKQYSLTLTNHSLKDLSLTRGGNKSDILIKSESPLTVESGDIITFNSSDPSPGSIRFLWRPVNLCFSLLKPEKRKSIQDDSKDAGLKTIHLLNLLSIDRVSGFSFSVSRCPNKEHTHFLPLPLAPTLAIGCALVHGIQLISDSWLKDFLQATRIELPATQKKLAVLKKKADESEEKYAQRCHIMTSLHRSKAKGVSPLEKDYKSNWENLVTRLAVDNIPDAFKSWLRDPDKLCPNRQRNQLFSDCSVILLAIPEDKDSSAIEQIICGGSGKIVVHSSPLDWSSPLLPQLQKLWPRWSGSRHQILIGTNGFISETDCEGQAIKTTDDLLHAICDVKKDRLVDPSTDSCEVPSGGGPSDDPASADDAPLLERRSSPTPRGRQRAHLTMDAPVPPRSLELGVGDHSTVTEVDSLQLIRRTASRTDNERMDALLPLDGEKVDEMEMLKKLATINNLADDTIVVRTAQTLNQTRAENPCSLDKGSESRSPSPDSRPPLLKRKAREPAEVDLDRYLPFLGQQVRETPASPGQLIHADCLNESAPLKKRPKLDHRPPDAEPTRTALSALQLDEVDINTIEGPASKMLREATQRQNSSKRKASTDLSPGEEDGPSENLERREQTQKKARIQTRRQGLERSRSDLSTGNEKGTQRKTSARSSAKSPKKTRLQVEEEDENEAAEIGEQFLSVQISGKRLTEEEIQTNLEFNRLRITKPPVLLKTKPISTTTRPIGWDEEDQSENELREMDEWAHKGTQPASSKSFFKVKYVSLVKKQPPISREDSGHRSADVRSRNFKKFIPVRPIPACFRCISSQDR
ncbi:hypothetical protein VP01_108g5 [Puccinia sorghi]|uniref:BRCT domain-containing protein n=1 Tax=Puccinia sorghi TaxID=27349 RepID=A0A0L6VT40_9BASI|nr:hypothetical protein VP01_108g5 [Puccinia sorghi]